MKQPPLNFIRFFVIVLSMVGMTVKATVFNIDGSQSQITLSGKIHTYTFSAQSPGSLTTPYFGFVNVAFSGNNIQFTGSGAVIATTNGNWKPGVGGSPKDATAPANYGATALVLGIPGYGAGRHIVLDISSTPTPIISTNFDSSTISISLPTNGTSVFDYFDAIQQGGVEVLTGTSTNAVSNSSIITNNSIVQLTIKIDTIINGTSSTVLRLVGNLIATNALAVSVPPPVIAAMSRTNNNLVLAVSNAAPPCLLQSSTDCVSWVTAPATSNIVNGLTVFTTPATSPRVFFRVQK